MRLHPSRARLRAGAAACLLVIVTVTPTARAQDFDPSLPALTARDDDGKSVFNLGQTMVTAPTKSERSADLTPGEVGKTTRDEMDLRQAGDLNDLLKYMPGVEVENGTRRIGQEPNIRGLSGARVLQTLDGGRMNFESGHKGSTFLDPDWLQSIEVVRGPASALYGSGAIGGVLAMRTLEADDLLPNDKSFGIRNSFSYAYSNQEFRYSPTVFGRIRLGDDDNGPERFTYLLSYTHRGSDNYDLGGSNGRLQNSGDDIDGGLATFVLQPDEQTKIRFSTATFDDRQGVPSNTTGNVTQEFPLLDRHTRQSFYNIDISHHSATYDWLNPELLIYYNRLDVDEIRSVPSRRVDEVTYETIGFDLRNRQLFGLDPHNSLALTYGVEYYHDAQSSSRSTAPVNGFFPGGTVDQISGYAQLELALFDELVTIIPGLRYDVNELNSDTGLENEHGRLSPKVGGVVKLDDEIGLAKDDYLIFSANFAEGFRAPLLNELFPTGTHFGGPPGFSSTFLPNPDLKPETSYTWEIGPRVKIGDVHLFGTYFETRAKDFIDATGPIPTLQYVNISQAQIKGVETGAEWEFLHNWLISAAYSRIRGDNETTGTPLNTIPADKFVAGLDYRNRETGFSAQLRLTHYFAQDRVDVAAGGTPSEAAFTVDLFFSWSPRVSDRSMKWIEGFRFDLGVENLTDEAYTPYFSGVQESGINPRAGVSYTLLW